MAENIPQEIDHKDDRSAEILSRLDELAKSVDVLRNKDIADDNTFNQMYQDIRQYQTDTLDQLIKPILLDLVQVVTYGEKEIAGSDGQNEAAENILDDIRDILDKYDVSPFEAEGNMVNPKLQKVIRVLPTDKAELDNTIAQCYGSGYMWGGKVLKTECVAIYKYKEK